MCVRHLHPVLPHRSSFSRHTQQNNVHRVSECQLTGLEGARSGVPCSAQVVRCIFNRRLHCQRIMEGGNHCQEQMCHVSTACIINRFQFHVQETLKSGCCLVSDGKSIYFNRNTTIENFSIQVKVLHSKSYLKVQKHYELNVLKVLKLKVVLQKMSL